jgi:hypothetical protein
VRVKIPTAFHSILVRTAILKVISAGAESSRKYPIRGFTLLFAVPNL